MSILEEIKAAEQAAAEAKRETKGTARDMMREAEEVAAKEAEEMTTSARLTAKKTVAAAEDEAKIKAKKIIAERSLEDRALSLTTREKLPAAVAYIIEKVVV